MHFPFFISLAAFAFSLSVHCLPSPSNEGPLTLLPINLGDFETKIQGIERRAEDADFSALDPSTHAQLIYGNTGENGQLLLANLTLQAPDGLEIVLLEEFEGLTEKVDCNGDRRTLSLTFKSEVAYRQALIKWKFINQGNDKNFILIANHDGCGPDDERQPYYNESGSISGFRADYNTLTIYLTARAAPWSEVGGTYTVDFGRVLTHTTTRKMMKERDLIKDIGNSVSSIVNGVKNVGNGALSDLENALKNIGSFDISKGVKFNVGVGTPALRTNIVTSADKHIKIDCIDCYITGSFAVTGHIAVKNFALQDFGIDANPNGFSAKAVFEATVTPQTQLQSLNIVKELYSVGLPGAGFAVPGIFKVGATLTYQIGVTSSFSGQGVVDFGLQASIPDAATVIAKVKNPASNSAVDFVPSINPVFKVNSFSARADLGAYSQVRLAFGAEITSVGKADIAISLVIPRVTAQLTASNVPCSPGLRPRGVKLTSKADVEVDLEYGASLKFSPVPAKSLSLYTISRPLLNTCFTL